MGKLGDTLRERRAALGLTLDQVEAGTRIRVKLLEALEEGHYDRLPDPGYVRGYISSYGRFLELDTMPLLNMYKAETGAGRTHELNLPQSAEAVKPTGQQHAIPWKAALAIAGVVAVISLIVWGIMRITAQPEIPTPVPTPASEPTETIKQAPSAGLKDDAESGGTKSQEQSGSSASEAESKQADQPFTVKVTVDADGASWVQAKVDGKNAYAGTLAGGQSKEWEVTKKVEIEIGRPQSVTVTRDGEPVKIADTGNVGVVKLSAKQSAE